MGHTVSSTRALSSSAGNAGGGLGDVLIVGAGPVGVYFSILLARMGVSTVVLEKTGTTVGKSDDERRTHPRAHVLHTRSMELMREIGLFEEIQREMPPLEQWKYFRYCTSLVGTELAAVDHCDNADGAFENLRRNSPAFVAHLSQPILESMLWRKTRQPPSTEHTHFLPHHQLERLTMHGDHVEVGLRHTKTGARTPHGDTDAHVPSLETRRFKYVVGADGARSDVRRLCGIQLEGKQGIESFISIHFECPALWKHMNSRGAMLYFIFNPKVMACMVAHDVEKGSWVAQVPFFPPLQDGKTTK